MVFAGQVLLLTVATGGLLSPASNLECVVFVRGVDVTGDISHMTGTGDVLFVPDKSDMPYTVSAPWASWLAVDAVAVALHPLRT